MAKKKKTTSTIVPPIKKLSAEAHKQAVSVVSVGCSRTAAAKFLGITLSEFEQFVRTNKEFAKDLGKAEAGVEVKHMQCVLQSVKDKADWRKSIWWLEHMRPEQYGKQDATARENKRMDSFLKAIVDVIALEVQDKSTRSRLLDRLAKLREE